MGNLGTYQLMTSIAKKVGGPVMLAGITFVGGYVVLRPTEAGVRRLARVMKDRGVPPVGQGQVFLIHTDGTSRGLSLCAGDRYRVLEDDGDAILIEVLGRHDNPHFVSRQLLISISDFPGDGGGSLE